MLQMLMNNDELQRPEEVTLGLPRVHGGVLVQ